MVRMYHPGNNTGVVSLSAKGGVTMEPDSGISADILRAVRSRTAEEVSKALRSLKKQSDLRSTRL